MRRFILFILAAMLLFSMIGCGAEKKAATEESTAAEETGEPQAPATFEGTFDVMFNTEEDNLIADYRVFPNSDSRKDRAYMHFRVTSEYESLPIRFLIEYCSIYRDEVAENPLESLEVREDKIKPVKANEWQSEKIDFSCCFLRITAYYNETSDMIFTRTLYGPDKMAVYQESQIPNDPPTFHPYEGLTEHEQEVYDLCCAPIFDYVEKHGVEYEELIGIWGARGVAYIMISYKNQKDSVFISVDKDRPSEYSVIDFEAIPEDVRNDGSTALLDKTELFYVKQALSSFALDLYVEKYIKNTLGG